MNTYMLLAQSSTTTSTGTDVFSLAQYGILGIIIVLMIFGKIVPGYILERKDKELEESRAELRALRESMEKTIIPALVRSTDILARMAESNNNARNQGGGDG